MRNDFVKRLWLVIEKNFDGKWTKLAKKAKISPGSFKRYLDGTAKPGFEQIIRICKVSNINPTWLLTGEGEMFIKKPDDLSGKEPSPEEFLSPELKKALLNPTIKKIVLRLSNLLSELDEEDIREIVKRIEERALLKKLLKRVQKLEQLFSDD